MIINPMDQIDSSTISPCLLNLTKEGLRLTNKINAVMIDAITSNLNRPIQTKHFQILETLCEVHDAVILRQTHLHLPMECDRVEDKLDTSAARIAAELLNGDACTLA